MKRLLPVLILFLSLSVVFVPLAMADNWPHDPMTNVRTHTLPGYQYSTSVAPDGNGGVFIAWQYWEGYLSPAYHGVDFVDADNGFIVGDGGTIVHTSDGGDTWTQQFSGTSANLLGVSATDANTATAVGENGTILRTTNGGTTWVAQTSGTSEILRGVSFINTTTGMAVGDAGQMLRTTDGGTNWVSVSVTSSNLNAVDFITTSAVCVVGVSGVILRSGNGGTSWIAQAPPTGWEAYPGLCVDFADANNGYIGSWSGYVFHTDDGGTTWTTQYPYTDFYDLTAVAMISTTTAYGVAGYYFVYTTNASSWNQGFIPIGFAYDLDFVDSNTGTVVGSSGEIYRTEDGGVTWVMQSEGDDVYAQHISASGDLLWGSNGVPVCARAGRQGYPQVATDGAGGALVFWFDSRASAYQNDVYAQRLDAAGAPLFQQDGIPVRTAVSSLSMAADGVVADDAGGGFVLWRDYRNGNADLFAQHVDAAGNILPADLEVCIETSNQLNWSMVGDGQGGAVVVWQDNRNGNNDLFARRVTAAATLSWSTFGSIVANTTDNENTCIAVADGVGGVVVAYKTDLGASANAIKVQHLSYTGSRQWTSTGVLLCDEANGRNLTGIVSDGSGGAIVAWNDYRTSDYNIYARRVDGSGTPQWTTNGTLVCNFPGTQANVKAVSDLAGGVVLVWQDPRNGYTDIYAQRLSSGGSYYWTYGGVPVSTAAGSQQVPSVVPDAQGGVIAVWDDYREGSGVSYAQRVERNGYLGYPAPEITSVVDSPGDQGGKAVVSWTGNYLDAYPYTVTLNYSVWRRIEPSASSRRLPVEYQAQYAAEAEAAGRRALAAGLDEALVASQVSSGWVYVDEVTAYYLPEYGLEAPTFGDSSSSGTPQTGFQVIAHSNSQFKFWTSDPAVGYSVDNLSPSAPLTLAGELQSSDVHLHWKPGSVNYEDLKHYAVYRGSSPGVTPSTGTLVGTASDTSYVDMDASGTVYYVVTAIDVHDNESGPSNEKSFSTATGVGHTPALPSVFTLLPNHPNPFTEGTSMVYGLPSSSDVTIEVYDVAGRRVFSDRVSGAAPGWHTYRFDGRDGSGRRIASGVYFYRMTSAGRTETRKMVIAR